MPVIGYTEHYSTSVPVISSSPQEVRNTVLPYNLTNKKIMVTYQASSLDIRKIEALAAILGSKPQNELTEDLEYLIVGNLVDQDCPDWELNVNLTYAKEHGVTVISESDFWLWCLLELEVYQGEAFAYDFERKLRHWQLQNLM
ncbi:hypothetical protein EQ500_06885 [Lactobacillus sp. XV13L]|nr:hypothetical protein [Lactobacillus sp. XV13L]